MSQIHIRDTIDMKADLKNFKLKNNLDVNNSSYDIAVSIDFSKISGRSRIVIATTLGEDNVFDCPSGGCGGNFINRSYFQLSSNDIRIKHYDYVTGRNVTVDYIVF